VEAAIVFVIGRARSSAATVLLPGVKENLPRRGRQCVRQENEVDRIIEGLASRFPRFQPATVHALVRAEFSRRSKAPVQDFVPVFVERALKHRLART
jgi:hypothetical protein